MKKSFALLLVVAMLLVTLAGCDSADYKKAGELYDAGDYLGAAEMYAALGDYEDSAEMAKESYYMYAELLVSAGSYEDAIKVYESLSSYRDSANKILEAEKQLMYITYADVFAALNGGVWFYESTSTNAVNVITFTQESANIKQIYYDGNGTHVTSPNPCAYVVNDSKISVTLADMSKLEIPYSLNGSTVKLGSGEYFTAEQVDASLQGYWGLKTTDYNAFTGFSSSEYIYYYNNGALKYESATTAYGYNDGTYYYYGPYTGTYQVNENGLVADARNNWQFGFLIVDGQVVMCRCGKICSPYTGFKGQYGFSFK